MLERQKVLRTKRGKKDKKENKTLAGDQEGVGSGRREKDRPIYHEEPPTNLPPYFPFLQLVHPGEGTGRVSIRIYL
jgi:hypothetical protein